jgi:hypothetical protein
MYRLYHSRCTGDHHRCRGLSRTLRNSSRLRLSLCRRLEDDGGPAALYGCRVGRRRHFPPTSLRAGRGRSCGHLLDREFDDERL